MNAFLFGRCLGLAVVLAAVSSSAAERQVVPGRVPKATAQLAPIGRLPGSQRLDLVIGLPLRNKEALTNLLEQIYLPGSPIYHQYLRADQFAQRFGPSEEDYQAVIDWSKSKGLTLRGTHPNRTLVDVNGSVTDIEKAFGVTMRVYQHPKEARTFYAPDVDPSLDLSVPVLTVHGLDNYTLPFPKYHLGDVSKMTPKAGSGPFGNYMGFDFRDAYVPGVALTGGGQVVGLFELDGYFTSDIMQYEAMAGLPNVPLQNVLLDGFPGFPLSFGGDIEVSLDIEMIISMAPGVAQVIVYEGFIPLDILNRMATDNLAKQSSCSWGFEPFDPAIDQVFQQFGAQGQSFYDASGDDGAEITANLIVPPSDDPYITQVGGTTLSTSGPLGNWTSETTWSWFSSGLGSAASSGGISFIYPIPIWQQGIDMTANMGSTTKRNYPDVALTADNIFVVAAQGGQFPGTGGTSAAAPLWAGFTALVNQQAAQGGQPTVGFVNPAIYAICKGPLYSSCFHDIITGNDTNFVSTNLFYAVPGYDLCTGWGTPTGSNLINALVAPVEGPVFQSVTNIIFGGNGNGVIDQDECNDLNVILSNTGSANATGVRAFLFSATPGVVIAQRFSAYPDMPVGASATNLAPFQVSTTPEFNCGIPVRFILLIQCDQTAAALQFTLSSGVPGTPQRYDNSVPLAIPAAGGTNSSIVVSTVTNAINKVTASVFLTDFFDQSMLLQLISPDGTTNTLSNGNGGNGQNYGLACSPDSQRTTFDDASATPINAGTPPFIGSYQPQQPLNIFNGKAGTNANGTWRLEVVDQLGFGGATLQCWSLFITPTHCVDGGGECPGADMALTMTAKPEPVIEGNNLTYTINVANLGPSSASNVVVSQLLPGNGAIYSSGSSSQGSISASGGLVICNLGLMRPGHRASITVVATTGFAGAVSSTASVTSEQPDYNLANNIATVVSHVNPRTADLAIALTGAPAVTYVGGPLTYSVTVTNNGPNDATGVTVTNSLPAGVTILSATVSQGSLNILSNVLVWGVGYLTNGSLANATIATTPTAQGVLVATATVTSDTFDPIATNNTATVSTIVGPAADLALGLQVSPNPSLQGGNVAFSVNVTNFGPSVAGGVVITASLPANYTKVYPTNFSGTASTVSNLITLTLTNNLIAGATTFLTVKAAAPSAPSTNVISATVAGAQTDPNPANNTAVVTNVVAAPFFQIVPAGALLTYQGGPVNGAVNPGELVTVMLSLANVGNISNAGLSATLLAANGVTPTNGATQFYGVLSPGGGSKAQPFSFIASGTNGGTVVATLQLKDGATYLTNDSPTFTFYLPILTAFSNTAPITIPDHGPASPYPSVINVSGVSGLVGKVTATLSGFYHTYPHDVSALLVGPLGETTLLLSHAGTEPVTNINLTFDDTAVNGPVPPTGPLSSGSWQPTAYTPPALIMSNPAPSGPYSSALSAFNGADPAGQWSLYVLDDSPGDSGGIANGWSLAFTTEIPVNPVVNLAVTGVASPDPVVAGGTLTYTFTVTNGGPDAAANFVGFTNILPAGVTLVSATSSQGSLATNASMVSGNLGTLSQGAAATVTVVVTAGLGAVGTLTSTATVSISTNINELNPGNSTISVVSTVNLPVADLSVNMTVPTNTVVVGSNLTFTIAVTNNGPQTAFNVVVTNPVPAGFAVVSTNTTQGTIANSNNFLTCNLGTLAAGAGATITVTNLAVTAGTFIDEAGVVTNSFIDTNAANNIAAVVVTNVNPAPNIVAAGALLLAESFLPPDGFVEPGETVTVLLLLANTGSANTTNLTATLLGTGGVTPSNAVQKTYGPMPFGGPPVANAFSFTAAAGATSSVTATLQLQDGANTNLAPVNFTFYFQAASSFTNNAAIIIPDHGKGVPYPSSIANVVITNGAGLPGLVAKATATLYGFAHTFPHDVSVLLVDPAGTGVSLMSHTGGGNSVTNLTLTFDDAATAVLPNLDLDTSGTYRPSNYQPILLPAPAPAQASGSALAALDGANANGAWSLYVFDDTPGDAGIISGGWSLNLTTAYQSFITPATLSANVANNQLSLRLSAQPNFTYVIQASTNLGGLWFPVSTNTTMPDGTATYSDTTTNSFKYRFYRAWLLAP